MSTNSVSAKSIKREWQLIDAKTKTLGRLATDIAKILMGKNKVNYVPYLDMGDFVVVTNAASVKVTGKKLQDKKYYSHSGYPGGLRTQTFSTVLESKPEEIIRHAVRGMLPNNKLRDKMIKKLYVFPTTNHPYKSKAFAGDALKKQLKQEETGEVANG